MLAACSITRLLEEALLIDKFIVVAVTVSNVKFIQASLIKIAVKCRINRLGPKKIVALARRRSNQVTSEPYA